jgi:hypothetical protein
MEEELIREGKDIEPVAVSGHSSAAHEETHVFRLLESIGRPYVTHWQIYEVSRVPSMCISADGCVFQPAFSWWETRTDCWIFRSQHM